MATGGLSDIDKGTDKTFDFLCTVCKGKNKNTEAEKFCADCQDYFCSVCVKSHNEIPILKAHKVLDKAQFQPGSSVQFPAVPTERCKVHGHNPVDMYCTDHDVVGCATCMLVQHSICKDTHYVPEYVQKNNTKACDPKDIATNLDALASALKELRNAFIKEKENLKRCKENSLKEIRKFRTEINKRLDELEQESVKEMEQRLQSLTSKLEAGLKELQNTSTIVASAKDSLNSSDRNLSQMFVSIKMADTAALHAKDDLSKTGSQFTSTEMSFVANQKLQSLLKELQVLGSVSIAESLKSQPHSQSSLREIHNIQTNMKSHGQSSSSLIKSKASSALMKMTDSRKYKVNVESDRRKCTISGACTLEDGTIILSDYFHSQLKRLHSSSFNVIDSCCVSAYPRQVCAITNQEVAICCSISQVIQFVSVGSSMHETRRISTDFQCCGIAYADGKLFVSDWEESVYVYKESGERLMCFREDPSGQKIFSKSRSLAVSTDTSKIYIVDFMKGLIILDYNGHLVGQLSSPELSGASDVCLMKNGNVLVCGWSSKNVVQFSSYGELLGEVLKTDGACQTVCYHEGISKLIVGFNLRDEIEVYDVSRE